MTQQYDKYIIGYNNCKQTRYYFQYEYFKYVCVTMNFMRL